MLESKLIDNLVSFGLTRQEAGIYVQLLEHGEMTGYEVSKEMGISRSNVYFSLSGLVEKGACYLIQNDSTKYIPVPMEEFVDNSILNQKERGEFLKANAPKKIMDTDGYITIEGERNIRNKVKKMLLQTELRVYILAETSILKEFEKELQNLVSRGIKVVIMSNTDEVKGTENYITEPKEGQIRLITDSTHVLTGEITGSEHDNCLYSGQKNLVSVMKEALKNQITLLKK